MAALAAALTLAVLLAACGGSSAEVPPTPGATTAVTQPPAPTATPVAPDTPTPAPADTPKPAQTLTDVPVPVETPQVVDTPVVQASPSAIEETPSALASRLAGEAWEHLVTLTEERSPRTSATELEEAAADYLVDLFQAEGYSAELQPFEVELLVTDPPVISVDASRELDIRAFPLSMSGEGRVSGPVVSVGGAFEEDLPQGGLEGKVALIERGTITFEEKVSRVEEAGALAAVIYNSRPGPFGGVLVDESQIPAVSISQEGGEAILDLMTSGDVEITVSVVTEVRDTRNVVAEKPGTVDDGGVVVLGGHYDTVAGVPGANDNGSGIATLLTVAGEVAEQDYPFTLRFVAFGSEEVGLRGSRFHVDSLGTGPVIGVLGEFDLLDTVLDYGSENGIEVERRLTLGLNGGSSDHASFQDVGVPVVFFLADDFSRIHTPDDALEFVQPELMGNAAALAIALLDSLAQSQ